ncbi:MAG: ABC transporter permease [Chloroflexi bacterium]|nr:ABC transporter permease [Chloroflexota bacterium]
MLPYVIRRLVNSLPVLVMVSALTFAGQQLIPGDPLIAMLGEGAAAEIADLGPGALAAKRAELGLDQPVPVQYLRYVGRVVQGDFGKSFRTRQEVTTMVAQRLPVTLTLSTITFSVNVVIGIALGVIAALRQGWPDFFATTWAVLGVATPNFWAAILLILVFSVWLGWLPASGWVAPWENFTEGLRRLTLPVLALGLFGSATIMRQTRSALLEVMRQDYITTARSKGVTEFRVVVRHALKNSMLPVVTLLGISLSGLIAGSVLIERVFAIPGVGRMAIDAATARDYPVIQAIVLMSTIAIVLANLLTDLVYGYLDPRIRYD